MLARICLSLVYSVVWLGWVLPVVAADAPTVLPRRPMVKVPAADDEHAHDDHGHGDHDHHAHIGALGANTDPSEFRTDLAIYTFIVFVLLLAILWKFAWGPIVAGLERREQRIAAEIAAAERANVEAKQLLVQYEQKLATAQDEVRAILDEARRDAEYTQQEIGKKAAADAELTLNRARREIDTAKDQALKELADYSAKLAVELAGRILSAELNGESHTRLIEEAVAQFPKQGGAKHELTVTVNRPSGSPVAW